VDQIAPRATEVARLLRAAAANLVAGAKIERIERSLPAVSAELALTRTDTLGLLEDQPSLEMLQSLLQNSAAAAGDEGECFASPDCRARACACRQRNVRIAGNRNIDHLILRKAARRTASAPGVAPALGCGSD
jgi:hypothetical protein